jgi:hypothetical protein
MHCRPLQRTCYTGSGMSLITGWMCVVWPRVHTLKDCNYQMRNLDRCRRWRCMLCPWKVRNTFFIHFWYRTILLCMPCIYRVVQKSLDTRRLTCCLVSSDLCANLYIAYTNYRIKPERKTRHVGLVRRWEDNIKMNQSHHTNIKRLQTDTVHINVHGNCFLTAQPNPDIHTHTDITT